jgi:Transposase DDE domain
LRRSCPSRDQGGPPEPEDRAGVALSRHLLAVPSEGYLPVNLALTAKQGFVLLPRRWVVERSLAWAARFRRLARDDERVPAPLAGFHCLAFVILLRKRFVEMMVQSA